LGPETKKREKVKNNAISKDLCEKEGWKGTGVSGRKQSELFWGVELTWDVVHVLGRRWGGVGKGHNFSKALKQERGKKRGMIDGGGARKNTGAQYRGRKNG